MPSFDGGMEARDAGIAIRAVGRGVGADRAAAAELLTKEATRFRRLVADKGYDANRYDTLAAHVLSTAALAAIVAFWL